MIVRNVIKLSDLKEKDDFILSAPTPTQMQIICYIIEHQNEEIYQKDLEDILNLRRATVSGVLQTMEKNNLIERVTSSNDTRTKKIILCEKTKDVFKENEKRFSELEKIITKNISVEELKVFLEVVDKMKQNMKNVSDCK